MNANLQGFVTTAGKLGIAPAAVEETPLTSQQIKELCRPLR